MKNLENYTDLEIIELCLKEDGNYFEEIIRRYKNLVYSIVNRMVTNSEDVNDLSQEIFIKIYKNLEKYSDEFKLSTWIMRISTNHVIDFRRKQKFQQVSFDAIEYDASDDITPETSFITNENKEGLNKVLNELPEMYREPIVLYHQKDMSYKEISDVLNEPLSKVKNRIFRGRKLLKEKIESSSKVDVYGL